MPDINGTYLGDQAGVLPSNTAALLHFSDQFARIAQQRRAQQAAQQRAEQERRIAFEKYMGTALNNKEFNTQTDVQSLIDNDIPKIRQEAEMASRSGNDIAAYGIVNDGVQQTLAKARKVSEANKQMIASLAAIKQQYPDVDFGNLSHAASKNVWFKKDANGNDILKSADEIDPTSIPQIVSDTYNKNPELFYSSGAATNSLNKLFDKNNSTKKLEESAIYNDANGNRLTPGILPVYVSPLVTVQRDKDGKTIYDKNNKAQIDIDGAEPYKLPDGTPYVTQDGKNVKVIPEETYNKLPPAFQASVISDVKKELNKPENIDQQGNQIHDIDSPYADMLKRNFAYNQLYGQALSHYNIAPQKDESFDRKRKIMQDRFAQIRNEIAQRNANRSDAEFAYRKNKDNEALTNPDGTPYTPTFDKLVNSAKPSEYNAFNGGDTKIVDVTDMDKDKYNELAGTKTKESTDDNGNPVITYEKGVSPYEANGRKFLIVNPNTGNLEGEGGTIERDAAIKREINKLPKGKVNSSLYQKAKNAVKSAMSQISGVKKGALN